MGSDESGYAIGDTHFLSTPRASLPPSGPLGRAGLSLDDFSCQVVGAQRTRRPDYLTVRLGAGANGSDRVSLLWPDLEAPRNAWLRVTVKANRWTGLAAPDVFYFGNLVGESGDGSSLRVSAMDLAAVKRALGAAAALDSRLDFNRDGRVNALDLAAARQNLSRSLPAASPQPPRPPRRRPFRPCPSCGRTTERTNAARPTRRRRSSTKVANAAEARLRRRVS